ncbi:hypothetical protein I7I48_05207 [Histoplasma ohiense]|nr:hypothetical protein I7I48_05207 [Histoplasma ohiense (nom. inval.)]
MNAKTNAVSRIMITSPRLSSRCYITNYCVRNGGLSTIVNCELRQTDAGYPWLVNVLLADLIVLCCPLMQE